jgi:arylsulfatase A-like enzyme
VLALVLLGAGVAIQLTRWIARRASVFDRLVRRSLPAMLATMLAIALAGALWRNASERFARARLASARAGSPNVLFIILDTVRAASMSLYGYQRETTPRLAALAEGGVTFERAITSAPWTVPAHVTLFSGLYPRDMTSPDRFWSGPDGDAHAALPEVFAANGYATAGFVANLFYLSRDFGLQRGFARYEDRLFSPGQVVLSSVIGRRISNNGRLRRWLGRHEILNRKTAARVNRDFLDWLDDVEGRPFFAFLNYYDAHEPYQPPAAFEERFVARHPGTAFFYDTDRVQRLRMVDVPAGDASAQRDLYDASIAALDDRLGELFDELERRNVLRNTIIIVSSDHGEEFMEHGKLGHTTNVWMTLLRVPLLLVYPDRVPARHVATPITLADVPATLVDLAGLSYPDSRRFPGVSLSRYWSAGARPGQQTILSEANPGRNKKSLLAWPHHLIQNRDGSVELYDLEADPGERHDLAPDSAWRITVETLSRRLESELDSAAVRTRVQRAGHAPSGIR